MPHPNGKWYNPYGEEIIFDEKDIKYSNNFWFRGQPQGLKEAMIESILKANEQGDLGIFVSQNRITEKDKEKLSAYRILAQKMGYEVGEFKFIKNSYSAQSSIKKAGYMA